MAIEPGASSAPAHIAVFRVAARGDRKIGSLFLNPGGPGYPGVGYAAMISEIPAKSPVSERFDIVGFDLRGTGASKPALDCFVHFRHEVITKERAA